MNIELLKTVLLYAVIVAAVAAAIVHRVWPRKRLLQLYDRFRENPDIRSLGDTPFWEGDKKVVDHAREISSQLRCNE